MVLRKACPFSPNEKVIGAEAFMTRRLADAPESSIPATDWRDLGNYRPTCCRLLPIYPTTQIDRIHPRPDSRAMRMAP